MKNDLAFYGLSLSLYILLIIKKNLLILSDLILLLRKLHEAFVAMAARLHQIHEAVKVGILVKAEIYKFSEES